MGGLVRSDYRYRCATCADVLDVPIPLDRLPGLLPHPDGGFMHFVGNTSEVCGPMRLTDVEERVEPMQVWANPDWHPDGFGDADDDMPCVNCGTRVAVCMLNPPCCRTTSEKRGCLHE